MICDMAGSVVHICHTSTWNFFKEKKRREKGINTQAANLCVDSY